MWRHGGDVGGEETKIISLLWALNSIFMKLLRSASRKNMAALYIVTWLQTKNYGLNGTDVVCDLASTRTLRRPVRVFKSQIVKWGSV